MYCIIVCGELVAAVEMCFTSNEIKQIFPNSELFCRLFFYVDLRISTESYYGLIYEQFT